MSSDLSHEILNSDILFSILFLFFVFFYSMRLALPSSGRGRSIQTFFYLKVFMVSRPVPLWHCYVFRLKCVRESRIILSLGAPPPLPSCYYFCQLRRLFFFFFFIYNFLIFLVLERNSREWRRGNKQNGKEKGIHFFLLLGMKAKTISESILWSIVN